MQPRLLITQRLHADKWRVPEGRFAMVRPDASVEVVGTHCHASILAVRRTAILVRDWYSKDVALERHHDPISKDYEELQEIASTIHGGPPFAAEGPELLLYIHGLNHPVTYLLASRLAKRQWDAYERNVRLAGGVDASRATLFAVKKNTCLAAHYSPMLVTTELSWLRHEKCHRLAKEFLSAAAHTSRSARRLRRQRILGDIEMDEDDSFLFDQFWNHP